MMAMAYNEEESDVDSLMDYMIDQEAEAEINNVINDDLAYREDAEEDMVNWCNQGRRQIEKNLIGTELNLPMDYFPHDGNWESTGRAIANNNTLRIIIHRESDTDICLIKSFYGRVSANQSIDTLLLRDYDIRGGEVFFTIMHHFLKRLWRLELCGNNIGVRGAYAFAEILSSRDCKLKQL